MVVVAVVIAVVVALCTHFGGLIACGAGISLPIGYNPPDSSQGTCTEQRMFPGDPALVIVPNICSERML